MQCFPYIQPPVVHCHSFTESHPLQNQKLNSSLNVELIPKVNRAASADLGESGWKVLVRSEVLPPIKSCDLTELINNLRLIRMSVVNENKRDIVLDSILSSPKLQQVAVIDDTLHSLIAYKSHSPFKGSLQKSYLLFTFQQSVKLSASALKFYLFICTDFKLGHCLWFLSVKIATKYLMCTEHINSNNRNTSTLKTKASSSSSSSSY